MDNSNNNKFNKLHLAALNSTQTFHQETQGSNNRYSFRNATQSYNSFDNQSLQQQYQSPHFNPNDYQTESSNSYMNVQTSSIDSEKFLSLPHQTKNPQTTNIYQQSQYQPQQQRYKASNEQNIQQFSNNESDWQKLLQSQEFTQGKQQYQQNQRGVNSLGQNGVKKGNGDFEQIFQKEYFEEIVVQPNGDTSLSNTMGDISSQRSSPFKNSNATAMVSINTNPLEKSQQLQENRLTGLSANSNQYNQNQSTDRSSMIIHPQYSDVQQNFLQNQQQINRNYNNNDSYSQNTSQSVTSSIGLNTFRRVNDSQSSPDIEERQKITSIKQNKLQNNTQQSPIKSNDKIQEDNDESNIMDSMNQLLKAVKQLKIAQTYDNNNNQKQVHNNQSFPLNEAEMSLTILEQQKQNNRQTQNIKGNANLAKYMDSMLNKVDNINQKLMKTQGDNNQTRNSSNIEIPIAPNNNQSSNQTGITFQFKTFNHQPNDNKIMNSSVSPKQSQDINNKSSTKNLSKSPLARKFLNPLQKPQQQTALQNLKSPTSNSRSPTNNSIDPSQDVINRLFQNHKRSQDLKDKRRYVQLQQELTLIQDKPQINERSKQIVMTSSIRMKSPIYSSERYQQEIETYQAKREQAKKLKEMMDREKERQEEEEMLKYQQKLAGKKITLEEFNRKYENQLRRWEARGKSKNEDCELHLDLSKSPNFKPQINPKSKQLAKDIRKIEERVNVLQQSKMNKIQNLEKTFQPTFTPTINKNTDKIINESKSFISNQGQQTLFKSVSKQSLQKKEFDTLKLSESSPLKGLSSTTRFNQHQSISPHSTQKTFSNKQASSTSRSPLGSSKVKENEFNLSSNNQNSKQISNNSKITVATTPTVSQFISVKNQKQQKTSSTNNNISRSPVLQQ